VTTAAQVTDEEITRQLGPDVSTLSVAQRFGVSWGRVDRLRAAAGIPAYERGRRADESTWREAIAVRVKPVEDGHAEWTGSRYPSGVPVLYWRSRVTTAYRAVFREHYHREPEGNVSHSPDCGREFCVAGPHLEDRRMRQARQGVSGVWT
jgi:hypothetical protein